MAVQNNYSLHFNNYKFSMRFMIAVINSVQQQSADLMKQATDINAISYSILTARRHDFHEFMSLYSLIAELIRFLFGKPKRGAIIV